MTEDAEHYDRLARDMEEGASATGRHDIRTALLKIAGRYERLAALAKPHRSRERGIDEAFRARFHARLARRESFYRLMDVRLAGKARKLLSHLEMPECATAVLRLSQAMVTYPN
jgi:hypothetical protein